MGRDDDQKVILSGGCLSRPKEMSKKGDIAEPWDFGDRIGNGVGDQPSDDDRLVIPHDDRRPC